jgi:arylsulfatase A-like enzyme
MNTACRLIVCVSACCSLAFAKSRPPNLIVILTDDQGYADVGFNGCKDIPTPGIDSIAANGVKFTSGYVSYSVCSPSRAGLLTGRYQQRFGHERNPRFQPNSKVSGLPLTEKTIADTLGTVGYKNGIIGKWHLGAHDQFHPLNRGFHEFFGHRGGGHRYFPEDLTIRNVRDAKTEEDSYRLWIERGFEPVRTTGYLTDEFSDEALRFVERHHGGPFFLYLAYNAPHAPMQATEKYLSRFPHIRNPKRRTYAAMVSAVDDGVGRLLAKLRELEIEKDTLVFFLSDNGGPESANASDNGPLRGGKSDPWEGGIRVPFAAQWPGTIPKGVVYDNPVISLDILATAAALSGAKTDPARPLDGVNLIPHLVGENKGAPHESILLRKFDQGVFAVRHGNEKLVIPEAGAAAQLFNLTEDLGETRNLADKQAEKLAEIEKVRARWNAQLIAPVFEGLKQPPAKKKPK